MWNVEVSPECIGSGVCAGTAPRHFTLGPDGRSRPLATPTAPDEAILDAAVSCPMEAIAVTDSDTGAPVET
ncbi:ferredoxin [Asanoa sp. WMMD1127]|uniref:ferredoxin n=1 Tax=Asanoa sp. WMMD1127 TaxID=3016107 RepID=UPI002416938F|nr:ferredoxin [Asanoa sp. WMMD1127]MDG4823259.1 ferredoxin [Asanoa sp. WMMD1127]